MTTPVIVFALIAALHGIPHVSPKIIEDRSECGFVEYRSQYVLATPNGIKLVTSDGQVKLLNWWTTIIREAR